MPRFLLQIVENDEQTYPVVRLRAGGVLERDIVEAFTAAIVANGVGLFKTEKQVTAAIRAGITAAIADLKRQTIEVA